MPSSNPRYAQYSKRVAVRKRLLATQDTCALCGRPIDPALGMYVGADGRRHWHPMAPEVDEIVPISKGGSPIDYENVQLVHRSCNQRKGNGARPSAGTARLGLPQSREW